ncbi:MAG: alpha/beta fold hydrolase [Candidatus Heimdallarchaeota archaeon]|nr:alpha/beta fold hydrolase [Candidatus Heimdallarchaeota archaeon]
MTDQEVIPGAEPFHLEADGSKVLLIHGFTASPTEMRPIGDYLHSKGFDIYSVLLPGHGTSPGDLQTKQWFDWWQEAKKAFESIDGCAFVIGFSMGALLAARLAAECADKLKGVVLISTLVGIYPKSSALLAPFLPLLKHIKPYLSKSPDSEQFFKEHYLISYLKYPLSAAHESIKLMKYTKKHVFSKITIPTLIIQGLKDDRVDPNGYKKLQELIPAREVHLELLLDSKHIVTVGPDKEQLFQSIKDFLTKYN